jgi:hydroxymethylbilane synthase
MAAASPDLNAPLLRLGTRGSMLAKMQSQWVADELERLHPGLHVELVIVKTSGDQITKRPLHELGGKGLFTKELELALLNNEIDFAVHSFKDVPVTMPLVPQATSELIMAAVPKREEPWDVLISSRGARNVRELPDGATIGTGSLRRRCQLLNLRSDLHVESIRGNIDTRLRKERDGEFDAIVLAMAGLKRTGLFDSACMTPIAAEQMLPAPGQGALALQCRRDDASTRERLAALNDPDTFDCATAEREIVRALKGDCTSPIAALAKIDGSSMTIDAAVGARGGELPVHRASVTVARTEALAAARKLGTSLAHHA